METLHQIMLLCRPGFESECAAEMLDHARMAGYAAYANARSDAGFAILASSDGRDMTGLIRTVDFHDVIFTRQWFASTDKITGLPENRRTAPLVDIAARIADFLQSRFCDLELAYPDTNQGKALSRFCRAFRPHMRSALEQKKLLSATANYRLHLFFSDSSNAWIGVSPANNSAGYAMGIPRLRMPASAPSRSTLKLEEAIDWFFDEKEQASWLRPGMRAVDLGAAPGGWTWQLVNRGLLVTAVDNGPMDTALTDSGMVVHARRDAFTYKPEAGTDWLVCDMAERPLHVSRLVARWFVRGYCKAAIFNLKLPMKKRYQTVLQCKQLLDRELNREDIPHTLAIKQLYHDREEVTACITSGDHHRR